MRVKRAVAPPWEKREMEARRRGVCIACDTCVLCTLRGWEKRFDDSLKLLLVLSAIGLRIIGALSRQSLSLLEAQSYRDRAGFEGEHRGKKKSKRNKSKLSITSIIRLE